MVSYSSGKAKRCVLDNECTGFQIMFLARIEGASLSKAYNWYVVEKGATDNAAQNPYLEDCRS